MSARPHESRDEAPAARRAGAAAVPPGASAMIATFRLALRMLVRDWRAGELTVLAAALVLAVASMGTVGFFADRVKTALTLQANLLLGADVVISSDRPLPDALAADAAKRGLLTVPVVRFNSMVQREGGTGGLVLATVKAVGPGYPLRGAVTLVDAERPEGRRADAIPARGEVWPDTRFAQRLGLKTGDRLAVGETVLTVGPVILQEPEVATGILSSGPRLLMHQDDVAATNLLQPGNRATYRLLVADRGGRDSLAGYVTWAQNELKPGQRLENVRDVQPEVRQTLERAERFLGLASLVAVMLAAVAVALAASRYLRRHLDTAAMLRCLGTSQRRALALFVTQFVVLGIVASAVGVVLALAGQALLVSLLASIAQTTLPPPDALPGLAAFAAGMLLLLGFALPPLVALAGVPPLRVLRRDLPRPRPSSLLVYALGAVVIALLIAWQAKDPTAGGIMVGAIGGLLVVSALAAWLLILLLKRLPQRGVTWRFGLANLRRRPLASSLQVAALALGLMALLLLTVVRGDLMQNWRASLPADAPNHFVINVLPDQVDAVRASLAQVTGGEVTLFPMVRGRLVAVNGAPLDSTRFDNPRARRLAEREFNLSTADTTAVDQPADRGPVLGARREARSGDLDGGRHRRVAAAEARGPADVRHRGHAGDRADHQPAQGRLGQLPAELLHAVPAGRARRHADVVPRCGARAGKRRRRRVAVRVRPAISERAGDRRRRGDPAGAVDHGPGGPCGRVRVPVHACRGVAGAAGGDRRDAGRAPLRCGDPAHAGRVAAAAVRRADRRVRRAGRAGRAAGRDGGVDHRQGARRSRVPDPVRGELDGVALGHRRRRNRGHAGRLAGHAQHGASTRRWK